MQQSINPKNSIKWLEENIELVIFLPPYTPQYAPVEHFFSVFKNKIMKLSRETFINLKSEISRQRIVIALCAVKQTHIINMFRHWYSNMKTEMTGLLEAFSK